MVLSSAAAISLCLNMATYGSNSTSEILPCTTKENIVFLCVTAEKVIGLCASQKTSEPAKLLQYRAVNKKENKLEFAYPATPSRPSKYFIFSSHPLPGGIDTKISFLNNNHTYTIHERSAPPSEGSGFEGNSEISVRNFEKKLKNFHCLNEDSEIRKAAYEIFSNVDQ